MNKMTKLLDILRYIRDNPPDKSDFGICRQVAIHSKANGNDPEAHHLQFQDLLCTLGYDACYPIDDPLDGRTPREQFEDTDNLWIGRQLELRLALLEECITYLEHTS